MKRYLQILLTILAAGAAFTVIVAGLFIGAYYYLEPSLPEAAELRELEIQQPLQIYTRDGRLMQEFGERKRTPVDYDEFPPLLIKAVLAAEDEHFWDHPGIDYRGIIRGAINEISSGGRNVGGSTITQQLPRALEVTSRAGLSSGFDRFVNKFKEWILAVRIEREFTKEEILALFLNTSFLGKSSYGMASAAQTYFGKSLSELTVSETAILAGILQRPADWNPIASPERATTRRSYVLRRMKETGAIDEEQYATAMAEPVLGRRFGSQTQIEAPYVGEMVRAEMVKRFGENADTAGLKVTTSIDSRHQAAANRAIRDTLMDYDERHGYRGPLAHVELPGGNENAGPAAGEAIAHDSEALRKLLEDAPPTLLDYETAIVLNVGELGGQVFFAAHGVQTIGLDAVEWAARFVTDDIVGEKPKTVADVLRSGDVVRFRRRLDGGWRLAQTPEAQGAFVAIDPLDGAIVALAGGFDFFLSNYNRATQARRQPGSSFKPFIYSAAFENGFTPATVVTDAPLDLGYQAALERVWRPENFGGVYFGPTRLREGLLKSMNSVSVRMLQEVGVPAAVEHVKRFGFDDTAVPKDLSLALGSGGIAPVDLATGYATFANGGYRVEHYFIDRVTTADGELLYAARPAICAECNTPPETPPAVEETTEELVTDATELYPRQHAAERVISARNAFLVADLLRDNVVRGSGASARRELGRNDLAGKTGTTNDGRDTWFVGFNAGLVGAAWVGFDDVNRPLGASEQGSRTALPMWSGFMGDALAGTAERPLARPPGIVEYRIDPATGLIANDCRSDSIFEKFDIDHLPEREAPDGICSEPLNALEPGSEARPSSGAPIF